MHVKKIPTRMCVGCGEHKNKKELVRVVRSPEGDVSLDFTGKAPGRGAYLCPNADCLKKAVKAHRFENAFKIQLDSAVFLALEQELLNGK